MEQRIFIDNLNHYLNWRGLPIELNEQGVCNGLASVYCKYVLENQENKFYKLLQNGADKHPKPGEESDINEFIQSIILSFNPEVFDKSLSQMDSLKTLTVNNNPLKAALQLGGVTNASNWMEIFKTISLQKDEAMLISSPSHTLALRRDEDGGYHLYDPNIGRPPYALENEMELLDALIESFNFNQGQRMPLMMQVVRHPAAQFRDLPSSSMIYNNYFKNRVDEPVLFRRREFTTLKLAARFDDKAAIETLSDLSSSTINAAQTAVIYNNPESLRPLLTNRTEEEYKALLDSAVRVGRKEVFELLMHEQPAIFDHYLHQAHDIPLIHDAAQGGSEFILAKIIKEKTIGKNQEQVAQQLLKTDILGMDSIMCAISGGNISCVRQLIEKIKDHEQLHEMAPKYLQKALEMKNSFILSYLLQELPKEQLPIITMNDKEAEQTSLCRLKTLNKYQLLNSPRANELLASSKASTVNSEAVDHYVQKTKFKAKFQDLIEFLAKNPFTHFLQEKLLATKQVFNSFKNQLKQITNSQDSEDTVQNTQLDYSGNHSNSL